MAGQELVHRRSGLSGDGGRTVMETTRVTLGCLRFPPDYAGPALRFQRYHPGLTARGTTMDVFTTRLGSDRAGDIGPAGAAFIDDEITGIRVRRLQLGGSLGVHALHRHYFKALAGYVARESPDVVQLLQLSPWGLGGLVKMRRLGVPIVYTHTMMPQPALGRLLAGAHFRIPYRLLDRLVVSSTAMRDAMVTSRIRARIDVIPNGVDLSRFRPVDPQRKQVLRQRLGLPANRPLVLFVGGFLEHRKGLDVLAEAWPRIRRENRDAHLVLVGPTFNQLHPEGPQVAFLQGIKDSLSESIDAGYVTFTGKVSNVEEYFQIADVFVFPSRREGLPNVVPEACACGAPTILTSFEGLTPELGQPGDTWELVERAASAIAAAVSGLLGDPERRQELSRNARAWVERYMDVERSLDAYAELYRALARKTKA